MIIISIKFNEYICDGLPVIANRSVEIIAENINKHKYDMLVDDLSTVDLGMINKLSSKYIKNISDEGIINLGVEVKVEKCLKIYSSMNN